MVASNPEENRQRRAASAATLSSGSDTEVNDSVAKALLAEEVELHASAGGK